MDGRGSHPQHGDPRSVHETFVSFARCMMAGFAERSSRFGRILAVLATEAREVEDLAHSRL